jgi:hypothetical protein
MSCPTHHSREPRKADEDAATDMDGVVPLRAVRRVAAITVPATFVAGTRERVL